MKPRRVPSGAKLVLGCALALPACSGELVAPVALGPSGQTSPGSITLPDGAVVKAGPDAGVSGSKQSLDCHDVNVGATPLQRLSRTQYANCVRDLLGISGFDVSVLPQDEKVGAFDGNTVAPVGDLDVEQYQSAAELAGQAAMSKLENLVSCDRAAKGDAACVTQFIQSFGLRAYRRPLSSDETTAYMGVYTSLASGRQYDDLLRVIVQTMLQSPNFLYHVELTPSPAGTASVVPLDPYELASRMAFFLTSSTPDDTLLEAARSGKLASVDGVTSEAARLLASAAVSDSIASFHLQWLELDKLDGLTKDATLFPTFSPALVTSMRNETTKFVDYVVRTDDAKLSTLFTAPYSFPEGGLLDLYGVEADATHPDAPIQLDPKQRAGILTQPSFLAQHAHYNQSAPVQRGKVMIRNVLCEQLPDPPPNVDTTPPSPSPNATTRQILLQHQTDPSCSGCHTRIDGIGLGFEAYDAIGAYRSMELGKPVDSSGEIVGSQDLDGPFNGAVELAHKLAADKEVQDCVVTQWLRFALGRYEADADACSENALQTSFQSSGQDIRALLKSIVASDAFRNKRVEATP